MNIPEANRHIPLEIENLQLNKENGLPIGTEVEGGVRNASEAELQCAAELSFLRKAGMDLDTLKQFAALLERGSDTKAHQIRILRKCRYRLLDGIHEKQQLLDQLDYVIYEIKRQNG